MKNQQARNIAKYVIPTLLSNVCLALFTIIDGAFVGQGAGPDALGAVNIALPYTMVAAALYILASIGGVAGFAVHIGRGEHDKANRVFTHSMIMLFTITVILTIIGTCFTEPVCRFLGANDTYIEAACDYLFWYSVFMIPSGISYALQAFCRNDGAPTLVSVAVIVSTAANIFGDWLLIFPFQMGTKGAAIATGASQVIGLLVMLTHFARRNGILRFNKEKLNIKIFGEIVLHGLPEGISQLVIPCMTLCMNRVIIGTIGDIGVNAFAVISFVASFTVAIFFGTSEGLQPLFGQSYGAKKEKDLKYYFRMGMLINIVGSAAVLGVILLLTRHISIPFGADGETVDYIVRVMPEFAWGFLIMSINVMICSYFYSTLHSIQAIIINLLRSLVFNMPIILLLPAVFGAEIVWYTFGIYELAAAIVVVLLLVVLQKRGIIPNEK